MPDPSDEPGGSDDAAEPEQPHRPDGLDLARAQALGAAAAPAAPARKRIPRQGGSPTGTGRAGRSRRGEAQLSGARPDGRDPQGLGAEVDRLIGDRGWGLDLQVRGVFARWPEIVGSEIGAHSTPETLTDGTLVVRTDSTAWATQLRLLAASVVRRLNEELGDGTVTVVEVLGPHAPSWKHGRRGTRDGRGPRDTYG
ncbi:MAG TPA: DciA family protein [Nocardioides sp.]|nr:DciA family protein [Nocardioides sp.]